MKLSNPVKDFKPALYPQGDVTQWFGENKQLYSSLCPSPGVCMTGGHNGIDIVRPHGEPIYCVESGIVVEALGKETGYGTHVKVLSDEGREWTYGHLSAIDKDCNLGQRIKAGQLIGKMGNTGFVVSGATPFWKANPFAGTHLHLGYRNVKKWEGVGQWSVTYLSGTPNEIRAVVQDYGNGAFGAQPISPESFAAKQPTTDTQTIDLTIQSLLNVALDLEKKGNLAQAKIVRAVAGVVRAFMV
jgi:murein DD-endopeptidase MepM/ murein hydrolase activator NlpD